MPDPDQLDIQPDNWADVFATSAFASLAGSKKKAAAAVDSSEPMDINKTTLVKIFKYPAISALPSNVIAQRLEQFAEALSIQGVKIPRPTSVPICRNNDVFVGVEVELENGERYAPSPSLNDIGIATLAENALQSTWNITNDDSLRNTGLEFITRVGLKAKDLGEALQILELYLRTYLGKVQANYRCGTHIHVDVRGLTVGQYLNLVILYVIFEDLFYKASGNRRKNIFCVPIRESGTTLEGLFKVVLHTKSPTYDDFRRVFKHFKKYSAFNLLPTGWASPHHDYPLGTVEFRHHKGTSNPTELCRWVQMIVDIHRAAQLLTLDEIKELVFGLNERANYLEFAAKVFGEVPSMPNYSRKELIDDMYTGSAFIKEVYLNAKGM